MSEEIKPAMLAEQWQRGYVRDDLSIEPGATPDLAGRLWLYIFDACHEADAELGETLSTDASVELFPADRHAIAALALHEQPFGFRSHEAEWLEREAEIHEREGAGTAALIARTIAQKIRALLPPQ